MQILGIDPGYATTGFGVVQSLPGTLKLLNYGTITTPAAMKFPQRLEMLYDDMVRLLDTVKPDAVAVEELFWGHNVTTGIGVSHGRGVILLAAKKHGVDIYEYTPLQIKQSVVGYGRAEKKQIIYMTQLLLRLPEPAKPDDTADALAVAICHGNSMRGI